MSKKNDEIDFAYKIIGLLDDPACCERMGHFGKVRVETVLE